MAEVEKQKEIPEEVETEEVDIEVETGEEEQVPEEQPEDFFRNLAEDMDERTLGRMSSQLIQDYKKDKISRADWEQAYTQGLDLLRVRVVSHIHYYLKLLLNFKHKHTKNYYRPTVL